MFKTIDCVGVYAHCEFHGTATVFEDGMVMFCEDGKKVGIEFPPKGLQLPYRCKHCAEHIRDGASPGYVNSSPMRMRKGQLDQSLEAIEEAKRVKDFKKASELEAVLQRLVQETKKEVRDALSERVTMGTGKVKNLAPRARFELAILRLSAEVVKNISALSGVAYRKLGAVLSSLAAPNPAPKSILNQHTTLRLCPPIRFEQSRPADTFKSG